MKYIVLTKLIFILFLTYGFAQSATLDSVSNNTLLAPGVKKLKDIIIYQDERFHSAFPSVIKRPNGELYLAFRRAPNREVFGEKKTTHTDPNSYLVMVRSEDGENWTKNPILAYAHPFGGSQDPCLYQLEDGTVLCSSYAYAFVRPDGIPNLKTPLISVGGGAVFLGGYIVRSTDGGKSWEEPILPPNVGAKIYNAMGNLLPAYNRGSMYQGRNKNLYWIVAATDSIQSKKTSNHLLMSGDKGVTWEYVSVVATDENVSFNEASIYETPNGDLVGFLRTIGLGDQACIARSSDGGKTFR